MPWWRWRRKDAFPWERPAIRLHCTRKLPASQDRVRDVWLTYCQSRLSQPLPPLSSSRNPYTGPYTLPQYVQQLHQVQSALRGEGDTPPRVEHVQLMVDIKAALLPVCERAASSRGREMGEAES